MYVVIVTLKLHLICVTIKHFRRALWCCLLTLRYGVRISFRWPTIPIQFCLPVQANFCFSWLRGAASITQKSSTFFSRHLSWCRWIHAASLHPVSLTTASILFYGILLCFNRSLLLRFPNQNCPGTSLLYCARCHHRAWFIPLKQGRCRSSWVP